MSTMKIVSAMGTAATSETFPAYLPTGEIVRHVGKYVSGQYRVTAVRESGDDISRIDVTLADYTGSALGFIWPERLAMNAVPRVGTFVETTGTAQVYNGRGQLRIRTIRELSPGEVIFVSNLICIEGRRPFHGRLMELEQSLPPTLRSFLARILLDPTIGPKFLSCRGSGDHHHSEVGGLARHSLSNLDLIGTLVERTLPHDELSVAIARLGYLLHDLGKIWTVGATSRPPLYWVVPHESATLIILAPHLAWLRNECEKTWAGLMSILVHVATPASARKRPKYFPAEVVVQMDQWSAATHHRNDLDALLTPPRAQAKKRWAS